MCGMCVGNQKLLVSLTFQLHDAENRCGKLEQSDCWGEDLAASSSGAVDWDGVAPLDNLLLIHVKVHVHK